MPETIETTGAAPGRPLVPCVTCGGEIPRAALTCVYCGQPTPASRIRRTASKRRNAGRCALGTIFMLAGFVGLFYMAQFPWNIAVGVTAVLLGAGIMRGWQCNHCGARVDRQTAECPRCALPFARFDNIH